MWGINTVINNLNDNGWKTRVDIALQKIHNQRAHEKHLGDIIDNWEKIIQENKSTLHL